MASSDKAIVALDFEAPIADLETRIEEFRRTVRDDDYVSRVHIDEMLAQLKALTADIYEHLNHWQLTQVARHPQRPLALDYIGALFEDFIELHGDRLYGDDGSTVGGMARFEGKPVMVIGQQRKGDSMEENIKRNFGMPNPEGYRKAMRLMKLAEKYNRPIITFIDTPGAYPGIGAEERGQGEAIARNLYEMASLTVPIVSCVIGEGGSGGALGIGVANRTLMLQFSIYSVISPESCASILWRDSAKKEAAADALKNGAEDAKRLGVIDEVIPEPIGGAHRNYEETFEAVKNALRTHLSELAGMTKEETREERWKKFVSMGKYRTA